MNLGVNSPENRASRDEIDAQVDAMNKKREMSMGDKFMAMYGTKKGPEANDEHVRKYESEKLRQAEADRLTNRKDTQNENWEDVKDFMDNSGEAIKDASGKTVDWMAENPHGSYEVLSGLRDAFTSGAEGDMRAANTLARNFNLTAMKSSAKPDMLDKMARFEIGKQLKAKDKARYKDKLRRQDKFLNLMGAKEAKEVVG